MGGTQWEVVGGVATGGITVRKGQSVDTEKYDMMLYHGSIVEEEELVSGRMSYKLLTGWGPENGWVTTQLKGKDLLIKVSNMAFNFDELPEPEFKVNMGNPPQVAAMIARRCKRELAKPALQWQMITVNTVLENHMNMRPGMAYGIDFPWNEETLEKLGPQWLTKAFHLVGSMPENNRVTKIILETKIKVTTGNNGGKFLFEVEYERPDPNLHTKLFAKVPHALEGPTRNDRLSSSVNKQPSELYEVNAYRMLESALPMHTPRFYFGDISNETSNWIIINAQIPFHDFDGTNFGHPDSTRPGPLPAWSVEGPYDKCIDHNLRGDPFEYYMLMTRVGAKMAAVAKLGEMGSQELLNQSFAPSGDPSNLAMWGMNPGGCTGEAPKQVAMKLKSGLNFMTGPGKVVFPEWLSDASKAKKFTDTMLISNAYSAELRFWMHKNPDYTSLGHQNLNVDNAYFWRDDEGKLDCGVFDWGGLGSGSAGNKLWWWYYCMDYEDFKKHIKEYLSEYVDTYKKCGAPQLDKDELYDMVIMSAVMQMAGLVSAVPQIVKMCPKKEWDTIKDRYDPRIGTNVDGKSTIRLYLHCMNTILRIIEELGADEILAKWIKQVYVGEFKNEPKTNAVIGLE